ncbi:hypothetical protein CFE70_008770 [Pyrenophora teres f. teres 0-1]|uniref:Uncharacterized protein n=2 Tax=Pyrenophora teres f. teres TaxID=97479 RepID=E3RYW3_PYRTT|nr:hypothetical protein PTT_14786 [Pyrenophora teres f. teres 0-1]KAE8824850.1 hypothetical protein PTNB85_09614 [Pyrenophora teres f. teres]KAE8831710.1 hypothetical protein HRS9139_05952 [Pyrenophora teres f. teres]KAE8835552.1 hypothetical protein HRS9122_07822 [Pyrenophora teres f. teres]KAE8858452.1 hypothetical protein PTNB29_07667 [Pyrenophora teres f. teres]
MWFFKVLPALYGLLVPESQGSPRSGISVVHVTDLVVRAPSVWPTVTLKIGVPATSVNPSLPVSVSTPVSASPGPIPHPYKYNSPVNGRAGNGRAAFMASVGSPLQKRMAIGYALTEKQYSILDLAAFCATIYSIALMAWWAVLLSGNGRKFMKLIRRTIPRYIKKLFKQSMCWAVLFGLVMAWFAWLGEYWTGWSGGYMTLTKTTRHLSMYLAVLFLYHTWPSILHFLRHYLPSVARHVRQWWSNRQNKKRIDKIFERPVSSITIAECLFPDSCLVVAPPNTPSISEAFWALLRDVLFFSWNLLILVVKCRIRSWREIPSHSKDIFRVTSEVLVGFSSGDDSAWALWLAGFRLTLQTVCLSVNMIFRTLYELTSMSLGALWMFFLLIGAVFRRGLLLMNERRVSEARAMSPKKDTTKQEDRFWNAMIKSAEMSWGETTHIMLKLQDAEEKMKHFPAVVEGALQNDSSPKVIELGKKCKSLRNTTKILISDGNYFRKLICALLEELFNLRNGVSTQDPNWRRYRPSLLRFLDDANPTTGMHVLSVEPKFSTPFECDPFACDPTTICRILRGTYGKLPEWTASTNPFNFTTRNTFFMDEYASYGVSTHMEDWAAAGRLPHWTPQARLMDTRRVDPFGKSEIQAFVKDMPFGAEPMKQRPALAPAPAATLAERMPWAFPEPHYPAWVEERPSPGIRKIFC